MATIANTGELITAITDLETPVSMPEGTIASKMDATEVNTLMQGIEDAFNKLYEKLRLLEDLHDFTKTYIGNEFKKNRQAFLEAKAEIDKVSDVYQQTTSKAGTVRFGSGNVVTDRDGTPIDTCNSIGGGAYIPASTTIAEYEPSSAVISAKDTPYKRVTTPARNYKSFYVSEEPPVDPVRETIRFVLPHPSLANCIDVSAFHAEIEKLCLELDDGTSIEIPEEKQLSKRTNVAAVMLELRSTKNETQDVNIYQQSLPNKLETADRSGEIKDTIFESMIAKNNGTTFA